MADSYRLNRGQKEPTWLKTSANSQSKGQSFANCPYKKVFYSKVENKKCKTNNEMKKFLGVSQTSSKNTNN